VILLARHGQTDDNVPPIRVQGRRDTPLNARGREQAHELAERAAAAGIASLWTSDLARARETAAAIGERLGLEPRVEPRFAESHRGSWEGRLFDEIEREEPEAFAAWRRAGADFRFPGGESLGEQAQRVAAALEEVRASGPEPALVVCHGGTIRVALCCARGRDLSRFHDWDVPNGALVEL
jgi:broad specificity phosphatase PhoE